VTDGKLHKATRAWDPLHAVHKSLQSSEKPLGSIAALGLGTGSRSPPLQAAQLGKTCQGKTRKGETMLPFRIPHAIYRRVVGCGCIVRY